MKRKLMITPVQLVLMQNKKNKMYAGLLGGLTKRRKDARMFFEAHANQYNQLQNDIYNIIKVK